MQDRRAAPAVARWGANTSVAAGATRAPMSFRWTDSAKSAAIALSGIFTPLNSLLDSIQSVRTDSEHDWRCVGSTRSWASGGSYGSSTPVGPCR